MIKMTNDILQLIISETLDGMWKKNTYQNNLTLSSKYFGEIEKLYYKMKKSIINIDDLSPYAELIVTKNKDDTFSVEVEFFGRYNNKPVAVISQGDFQGFDNYFANDEDGNDVIDDMF